MKNWLMRWQELKEKHPKGVLYLISALLPMTIMLVVWFFMGSYPFGNKSLMAVDFGQQYISFFGLLKNAILSGDLSSLTYSFTKSIGGDMIGVLGYYLMSPFNIIYIILPFKYYGLAVFLTIWLRYGAIGLSFAHLVVKRYKGAESKLWMVPLFATAYALSGMLVSYQMNVIFYASSCYCVPGAIVGRRGTLSLFNCTRINVIASVLHGLHDFNFCCFVCLLLCITTSFNRGDLERKTETLCTSSLEGFRLLCSRSCDCFNPPCACFLQLA